MAASGARTDWPCGVDALIGESSLIETTFEYNGPTRCRVPVDLHSDGIIGCPTRITQTALRSGKATQTQLSYDQAGHLVGIAHAKGITYYLWDGDILLSRTNHNLGHTKVSYDYVESADHVELVRHTDDGPATEFVLLFQDDQLASVNMGGKVSTLTWSGPRLQRVDSGTGRASTYQRPLYDCHL